MGPGAWSGQTYPEGAWELGETLLLFFVVLHLSPLPHNLYPDSCGVHGSSQGGSFALRGVLGLHDTMI